MGVASFWRAFFQVLRLQFADFGINCGVSARQLWCQLWVIRQVFMADRQAAVYAPKACQDDTTEVGWARGYSFDFPEDQVFENRWTYEVLNNRLTYESGTWE